jgi:hypothetical protein
MQGVVNDTENYKNTGKSYSTGNSNNTDYTGSSKNARNMSTRGAPKTPRQEASTVRDALTVSKMTSRLSRQLSLKCPPVLVAHIIVARSTVRLIPMPSLFRRRSISGQATSTAATLSSGSSHIWVLVKDTTRSGIKSVPTPA